MHRTTRLSPSWPYIRVHSRTMSALSSQFGTRLPWSHNSHMKDTMNCVVSNQPAWVSKGLYFCGVKMFQSSAYICLAGCILVSTRLIHLLLSNARFDPFVKGLTVESPMSCAFWPCQHNNLKHVCFPRQICTFTSLNKPSVAGYLSDQFLEKVVWFTCLFALMWFAVRIESSAQTWLNRDYELLSMINSHCDKNSCWWIKHG